MGDEPWLGLHLHPLESSDKEVRPDMIFLAGPGHGAPGVLAHWVLGPGAEFFNAVQRELGSLPFIAEDLGLITPDVCALRDEFHIPGTRVLQFAFDRSSDNPHLPESYSENTVVYTGTHHNNTTRGWFEGLPETEQRRVWGCLNRTNGNSSEIAGEFVRSERRSLHLQSLPCKTCSTWGAKPG